MLRIGIPSAMFYYIYYPMWKTFFEELGVQVVTSGKTTRQLLDNGVREALADACVPVKVYFGHAMALANRVDYLFIPRIVCLNKKTVYCPKFLGLPDMIRYGIANMPPIIDVRIDARDRKDSILSAYYKVGKMLGKTPMHITKALLKARMVQFKFDGLLHRGLQPLEAMDTIFNGKKGYTPGNKKQLKFAVVGYPYIIHDQYISIGIANKLQKMGIDVVTSDNLSPLTLRLQRHEPAKQLFWTFSERTLRATRYYARQKDIDGIIHLTAFGCGPDSIVDRFIQLDNYSSSIPFMSLTIDEHSGEAGVNTRLEAFVDMVRRKKGAYS
ncbi:acyl-CoA dehydratase activase-related protein [Desulfallas thermosapovorans]|uniref:Putative nucleotide-binding protein (Sugar kinase/HSP70/actin superfamily) n=1 Tax=Desulfallas thermosapovorans DSM 6562 TaxID=1121431 RepID=A0A5S4ZXL4_9FIRM|nr:acyl-CoA dehydratase activase-related protein [Desulfallas thermosapovorans]TYO97824.1 putative nucleotide-binding protein (sugar kinase/HSP70/actin superfamily) [Desulfallas thermosapovorans DSM 6562]